MSIDLMSWVWTHSPTKAAHRLVLLALADSANDEGYCWPGMASIARKANYSRSHIMNVIQDLERDGHIQVIRRSSEYNHETNYYRVIIDPSKEIGSREKKRRVKGYTNEGSTHVCTSQDVSTTLVNTCTPGVVNTCVPESSLEPSDKPKYNASLEKLIESKKKKAKPNTQPLEKKVTEEPKQPAPGAAAPVDPLGFLPKNLRLYADAFVAGCNDASLDPAPFMPLEKERKKWIMTINEWISLKLSPDMIRLSVPKCKKDGWRVSGITSVTTMARSLTSEDLGRMANVYHAGDKLE